MRNLCFVMCLLCAASAVYSIKECAETPVFAVVEESSPPEEAVPLEPEPAETEPAETNPPETEPSETEPEYISLGEFRLTAYCSCEECCGKWALNRPIDENGNEIVITASGAVAVPGYTVATDPSVIPWGTHIYIDGHEFVAQDCGGGVTGNSIDIYVANHADTEKVGLMYKEVFLKEEQK